MALPFDHEHSSLRICTETGGVDPMRAFAPRELLLPEGHARQWQDVYRCWFGAAEHPLPDYTLWYGCPPSVDDALRRAFEPLWHEAVAGRLESWDEDPRATIAKIILIDQFSRHIHRGRPEAFAHDAIGRRAAERCLEHLRAGRELHIEEALIMTWPWLHSESLSDIDRALAWLDVLAQRAESTRHRPRIAMHRYGVGCHRDVVARFGRYPHRNRILGRASTEGEERYLAEERPMWGTDQWPEYRGGTWGFRFGMTRYVAKMLRTLVLRGELRSATLLASTLRPSAMFARKRGDGAA